MEANIYGFQMDENIFHKHKPAALYIDCKTAEVYFNLLFLSKSDFHFFFQTSV